MLNRREKLNRKMEDAKERLANVEEELNPMLERVKVLQGLQEGLQKRKEKILTAINKL